MELVAGAIWTPQAEFCHSEDALEMGEQHLDLLALATGLDIGLGLRDVPGDITRRFVDRSHDLAMRLAGTTPVFQGADVAVSFPGTAESLARLGHAGALGLERSIELAQLLACRTGIMIRDRIIREVGA